LFQKNLRILVLLFNHAIHQLFFIPPPPPPPMVF
jgi:hypothetical protein